MRKLLMAAAAAVAVGASLGIAQAAEVSVVNPSLPQQPTAPAAPATPALSNGNNPVPLGSVAPGQLVMRIELQENVYFASGWSTTQSQGGDKMQPYGILGYPRLYMGVDGQATNGLLYGVYWQIRNGCETGVTCTSAGSGTAGSAGVSGQSGENSLFWRYAYIYAGTAQLGIGRIGVTPGPMMLFLGPGVFDDIATGGWNGDINDWENGASFGQSGSAPNWPWPDVGNEYDSAKVVYLSPKFWNMMNFGFSYEPSDSLLTDGQNCAGANTTSLGTGFTNCNNQSTSTAANDLQRRRNTIELGGQFSNTFNGVGISAAIAGMFGGHVLPAANNPGLGSFTSFTAGNGKTVTGSSGTTNFENILAGEARAAVTFAGVTVGGSVIGGQYNGQWAPLNAGGIDSFAWMVGGEYNIGPLQVGASWFTWKYQGYWTLPGAQTDAGLEVGTTYNIAPGLNWYAEYLYGQRYKGDFNFETGAPGAANNNAHVNIIGTGLGFRW